MIVASSSGGQDVGRRVGEEGQCEMARGRAQEGDEQAGDGEADDVGQRVGRPGRAVGGHHVVLCDDARQQGDLGRAEEQADRGDEEDERVDEAARSTAAANGIAMTSTARMRSLAIITRLCSQRSTNVPAIGPRTMFGSVAARKTKPGRERRVGDREDEHTPARPGAADRRRG